MNIKQHGSLILNNLFFYDVRSCYYTLLDSININLDSIEYSNKKERNKKLGLMQRDNKILSAFLSNEIDTILNYYIRENKIDNENIIVRQKDGFILDKKININSSTTSIDFRGVISKLIIDFTRKKYLALFENGKISVKGVSTKPVDYSFYHLFFNLDFSSKYKLINSINLMRNRILNSKEILWFCFLDKEPNTYKIPTKFGFINSRKNSLDLLNIEDIQTEYLWDNYLWPFIQPLLFICHK